MWIFHAIRCSQNEIHEHFHTAKISTFADAVIDVKNCTDQIRKTSLILIKYSFPHARGQVNSSDSCFTMAFEGFSDLNFFVVCVYSHSRWLLLVFPQNVYNNLVQTLDTRSDEYSTVSNLHAHLIQYST